MYKITLHKLPISAKILITLFLLILSMGYLFALLSLFLSTRMYDGQKGLSIQDVKIKYRGDRSRTLLENKINTTMRSYLPTEKAKKQIEDWIASGAGYDGYEKNVKPIFEKNCVSCHSTFSSQFPRLKSGAKSDENKNPKEKSYQSPLTNYEEVLKVTEIDTGKSYERLAQSSHTHVISMSVMFFLVGIIFFFTSFPKWLKIAVFTASFASIVIDIGSWWLTKMLSPIFAYFIYSGGMLMGLAFGLQVFGCLYQLWLKFEECNDSSKK